jgi:rhamnogalacturonyl hydrolase YesR
MRISRRCRGRSAIAAAALLALCGSYAGAQSANIPAPGGQRPGRSDPAFSQPSLAVGVDYTVPTEAEIKIVLDRIREHFVRSTPYQVIDTATGQPVTDLSKPTKTAGIDNRKGEFNDWTYSMGVVLAAMLHVTEATGDTTFQDYTFRNFDFIFQHLPYFRQQAKEFGPQSYGYRRLIEMRELDDCGAIGAALIRTYAKKPDPRYKAGIDLAAAHILTKQLRLPDKTLARSRPVPVALWIDDAYMSIPFLAQLGKMTGETKYYDDAARQVIGMSARLFDPATGLFDHSWFANMEDDARFFWGRGDGWALMAMAELLSVLPENHPERAKVLETFRRASRGAAETQGGTGLWHQLLNKPDSYLETSASAMFTFAIARGVNRGWLPTSYAPIAQAGWRALEQRVRADGQIEGICVGTTAAYDAVYYYNRPTDLTAMQGYGPTLMAGAEVMTMIRSFEIRRVNNTFYYFPKQR